MFALVLLAGPATVLANARLPDGAPLSLVILPPWMDAEHVLRQAETRPVGPMRAPIGLFAMGSGPDLSARLYRAGAWAVLDGRRLAALCGG
ncbi:hypothetical protein FGG78_22415 [Thioclava sp. BHET1]|nr:hypothetical protein FGG78_22415 [Thioclava sp. BHET1]